MPNLRAHSENLLDNYFYFFFTKLAIIKTRAKYFLQKKKKGTRKNKKGRTSQLVSIYCVKKVEDKINLLYIEAYGGCSSVLLSLKSGWS